jgi:DNA-binding HxlR family transcriptional regulator
MARTHKKVSYSSRRNHLVAPAENVLIAEDALKVIEGRWKLRILVQLRANAIMRFSDLERAIPSVTQKMLIQQLRELERDGAVTRTVYAEVPPRVEYSLTPWGQDLCPALDALRTWAGRRNRRVGS